MMGNKLIKCYNIIFQIYSVNNFWSTAVDNLRFKHDSALK